MLDEPHPPPKRPTIWQRTWRRRQRDGARLAEVSAATIELLIAAAWLKADEADDQNAIAAALDAFARAALKNLR
jgi:hypothetical protein